MRARRYQLLLLWAISSCIVCTRAFPLPARVRLRAGFPDDNIHISLIMAKELMNPLGISHKNNLIVAEDTLTGERVEWAQIRALGYAGVTTDPSRFEKDGAGRGTSLSRREVQSKLSIEEDVDEMMWEEFEESAEFPNGLASLPWTEEYRAASRAATERMQRRERLLEMELASRPKLWELSSVYVVPEWRGKGIGQSLVSQVLERHASTKTLGRDVYALTLKSTLSWYRGIGFDEEKEIPRAMAMEMNIGRALTKMMGEELVCIRTTLDS